MKTLIVKLSTLLLLLGMLAGIGAAKQGKIKPVTLAFHCCGTPPPLCPGSPGCPGN